MALHSALTGSELHEPKGVATAQAGKVYKANGSGSGSWTTIDYNSLATGMVVQTTHSTINVSYDDTTTAMPVDNSIPQITEGFQVAFVDITPKATTHKLLIEGQITGQWINAVGATWAIFQDATANAIAAGGLARSDAGNDNAITTRFGHWMAAGTTIETRFWLRAGPRSGGHLYINGGSSNRLWGGVSGCWIRVTEYKA